MALNFGVFQPPVSDLSRLVQLIEYIGSFHQPWPDSQIAFEALMFDFTQSDCVNTAEIVNYELLIQE